jgi:hypothetical protein
VIQEKSWIADNIAMLAVATHLILGANLLTLAGNPYVSDGGLLIWKIHPGSYLAYIAAVVSFVPYLMRASTAWEHLCMDPLLIFGMLGLIFCVLYEMVFTGPANPVVLLDTFLPAGMLAFATLDASEANKSRLLRVLQSGFVLNAVIALSECAVRHHLLALDINGRPAPDRNLDFRALALYDHPLTGATASALALLMPLDSKHRILRLAYKVLMGVALIAFGGRIAILVALFTTIYIAGRSIAGSILHHRESAAWLLVAIVGTALAILISVLISFQIGLGERLRDHLYWDSSAQVRLQQWRLLGWLDASQLLFGCPRPELLSHIHMLDLSFGVGVIENFWLLMFVGSGVLAFPIFLLSCASLALWCWRQSSVNGRVMIIATLAIASTSNSLGRKSPLLVLLVAAVVAESGARSPRGSAVTALTSTSLAAVRRHVA